MKLRGALLRTAAASSLHYDDEIEAVDCFAGCACAAGDRSREGAPSTPVPGGETLRPPRSSEANRKKKN
jgi:hypothetical protein